MAAGQLVGKLGAELAGFAFLVELTFLRGRHRLEGNVLSLIRY
jgi:adenine/guanine phosphoribosyltransferase-like PRPP-binding protein